MNLNRILFYICCSLVLCCGMAGLSSCGDDDDYYKVTIYKNPKWKAVENVIATLRYDDSTSEWVVEPDIYQYNPFWRGEESGSIIRIVNWDDSYKQFADGCIFSGEYRVVKDKFDYRIEGIPFGYYYMEVRIDRIDKYEKGSGASSSNAGTAQ